MLVRLIVHPARDFQHALAGFWTDQRIVVNRPRNSHLRDSYFARDIGKGYWHAFLLPVLASLNLTEIFSFLPEPKQSEAASVSKEAEQAEIKLKREVDREFDRYRRLLTLSFPTLEGPRSARDLARLGMTPSRLRS